MAGGAAKTRKKPNDITVKGKGTSAPKKGAAKKKK